MPDPGQFVFKDSVGGAAVRGSTGRVLELDAADLFALDFSDAPALALNHPAGVAIDLDPAALNDDERKSLADMLATLAHQLRRQD